MIGETEWIDIVADADTGSAIRVCFNTADRLTDETCPRRECGSSRLILGCNFPTNETYAWCLRCGYGYRYVLEMDIC